MLLADFARVAKTYFVFVHLRKFRYTHFTVAYPGSAGCPENYAHAHNIGGRGPAHVKFDRRDRTTGQFCALRVAGARAYPRIFLAFVGFSLASYRRWAFRVTRATNRKSD